MPKAPRDDKDSLTPKKRTRKATSTNGNGVHAGNGNGSSPQSVVAAPEEVVVGSQVKPGVVASQVKPGVVASQVKPSVVASQVKPGLDEQIRERAYELYLRRGGNGGSPEQDWLQARQEICGE
jgi:Protein of unknown function (DUF2934)